MKRLGILACVGLIVVSLTYLFNPRSDQDPRLANRISPHQVQQEHARQGCLNINTATVEEIESLPGIGKVMAERIVAHRQKHGSFARPEDLLIIDGIGEKKYRAIADLICVE
jgi:competence ComEA-like helix-hairpin-helix protein